MAVKIKEIFRFKDESIDFAEPSSVMPKTEVIKNSERALSGRMSVDFVSEKTVIQVLWDIVSGSELDGLKRAFPYYKTLNIDYNDKSLQCYVDALEYKPTFIGDTLYFTDVSVELVEI